MLAPLRVAITGANGYIGRRLVAASVRAGYQVVALVRDGKVAQEWVPADVEIREWSLSNPRAVDVNAVDVVCHLAAFIPPSMADPRYAEQCVMDNALGTLRLLTVMQHARIPQLIYFSTGQLYRRKDSIAREDDPLDPADRAPYYLGSKLLGEMYCRHAAAQGALAVTTLRIGSVYGPGMASAATVLRMISDARAGRPIRLADGGRYGVDLVFVDDVVGATMAAIQRRATGVFNVGSGVRTTMKQLARAIFARYGGKPPDVEPPVPDRAGALGFSALDISRASRELDYIPTSLESGLERMAAAPVA